MGTQGTRARRHFAKIDGQVLLEVLGTCRAGCVDAIRRAELDSEVYRRCTTLLGTIDDVAEILTGDREHFWLKPTSNKSL